MLAEQAARWPPRHHALGRPGTSLGPSPGEVGARPDLLRDGNIWSSAGITAGIDLALAMAAEDFGGRDRAEDRAQLVLYHRRSGASRSFSSLLELKATSGRFGRCYLGARASPDAPLTGRGPGRAGRHEFAAFARAFIAETGTTPSKAVERLRIEGGAGAACNPQRGDRTRSRIHGFRDPERMRRALSALRPAAAIAAPAARRGRPNAICVLTSPGRGSSTEWAGG